MSERAVGERVNWYRCYVSREDLSRLNKKNNFLAFAQTLGYLGTLAITGTATYLAFMRLPLPWSIIAGIPLLWFHGMCFHFLINGFHELIHDSVFKQKWLNLFFLRIYSFLGWYNHIQFWASHTEHHKFTLHPPDDLEVTLPQGFGPLKDFLKHELFSYGWFRWAIGSNWRLARGKLSGQWEHYLFDEDPVLRRKLFNWSRFVLIGHTAIFIVAMVMHWWALPLVVTFPMCIGGAIHAFTNSSQHIGLRDNVPDFRLCCRTIYLSPFLQFLYWHMNYHTEHHMFAAVPCYKLPQLHRLIKDEMPYCPTGLRETWKGIREILEKQKADPKYQFSAELPPPKARPTKAGTVGQLAAAATAETSSTSDEAESVLGVMANAGVQPKAHVEPTATTPTESATPEAPASAPATELVGQT